MDRQRCLQHLLSRLNDASYCFICPSPESQARTHDRSTDILGSSLTDLFGWNILVNERHIRTLLEDAMVEDALEFDILTRSADRESMIQSNIRVSNFYLPRVGVEKNIKSLYYVHSSFPANSDAVFFGPDSYLFLDYLEAIQSHFSFPLRNVVDVCCGAGAGAIHVSRQFRDAAVFGLDLNPKALDLASVNALHAGVPDIRFIQSNLFKELSSKVIGDVDLILSNPPYIATAPLGEADLATYADGGTREGLELAIKILEEGLEILAHGGLFVIYTGVTISMLNPGLDPFLEYIQGVASLKILDYRILQPDMWPEEIGKGAYVGAGRIQTIGTALQKI